VKQSKEPTSSATNAEIARKLRVVPVVQDDTQRNRRNTATTAPRMEISTRRQTCEEERQFEVALDLFLCEMVREFIEGRDKRK
jgi:hypothetical protein